MGGGEVQTLRYMCMMLSVSISLIIQADKIISCCIHSCWLLLLSFVFLDRIKHCLHSAFDSVHHGFEYSLYHTNQCQHE